MECSRAEGHELFLHPGPKSRYISFLGPRCWLSSVSAILLPYGIICSSNEELLKVILYGHE